MAAKPSRARGAGHDEAVRPEEQQGAEASGTSHLQDDGIQEKISARTRAAEWVRQFLKKPLTYEVVFSEGAPVREAPSEEAREVACLPKGSTVEGFCGQDWLSLHGNSSPPRQPSVAGNWAFIGARLRATCLRVLVERSFAEAVDMSWPGLDVHEEWRVQYGLKWRPAHSSDEGAAQAASSTSQTSPAVPAPRHNIHARPWGTISGLLPGQPMRFSVVVQLSLPGGGRPQKIAGPWSAAVRCPELDLCLQGAEGACSDGLGNLRGGCAESACSGWVQPREPEDRCARCGAKAGDHDLLSAKTVKLLAPEVAVAWPPLLYFTVEREVDIMDWPSERSGVLGRLKGKGLCVAGYKYGDWVNLERDSSQTLQEQFGEDVALWIRCGGGSEAEPGVALTAKAAAPAVNDADGDGRLLTLSAEPASISDPAVVVADQKSPAVILICGHSSSPWLTELLALHSELCVVTQIDFIGKAAKVVLDERLEFPAFRKEVLRLASQAAEFDEPEATPWIHGGEAIPQRPSLGLELVLQATHKFLDAVRSGRPRLPALGRLLAEILEEYARQDGSTRTFVWEPPDCPQVLPLLGAACPRAKVIHCVADVRGVACSSASAVPPERSFFKHVAGKAQAWTEAAESAVSWGLTKPDRYFQVRSEDMARHPRRELSRILERLGVGTSGEDDAWELLKRRRKEANPKREEDGASRALDSPRLRRIFEGRTGSALQHFGYIGNDASPTNGRLELPDEEPAVDGEAGTIVQGKMLFRKSLEIQANLLSPTRSSDSPAWATSPSGGSLKQRRATTGALGVGSPTSGVTRTPPSVRSGMRTPPSIRSGMRTPPGIQRAPDAPAGMQKAKSTSFGADCSEELASILQRRLARAEPNSGLAKPPE